MKEYPSIPREIIKGEHVYVFDKIDGSNIRCNWIRKSKTITKFGSRHQLIDLNSDSILIKAIPLIKQQEESLNKILFGERIQEATLFFEFYGDNSFAGVHDPSDNHKIALIDVNFYKQGFINPKDFIKLFVDNETVATANYLCYCKLNQELINQVRESTLEGMTFEGVVCKTTRSKLSHPIKYCKIKSNVWIDKVKSLYTDPQQLEELL